MTTPAQQPTIPATNVMLDIETYGLAPGSVIKTIGAVKFALAEGKPTILDRFYNRISVESSDSAGLKMDAATVEWWLQQSDQARAEMVKPGEVLSSVLKYFALFLGFDAEVWGNGVGFDNTLLRVAYNAVRVECPWKHTADKCYRTIKNANQDIPIDAYRVRTQHNALDDAESQAMHLMAIWQRDEKRKTALMLITEMVSRGILGENADLWETALELVS